MPRWMPTTLTLLVEHDLSENQYVFFRIAL